ncbi:DUF2283 domain-containing protein [Kibdelosporangium philippinense]|uniref:DUF2283 domain-containing protein n=1 Tax=Kibdelosporangium philippinense TaxID=211113 RepID=A0ABS8Z666_9PSEU|nr:DUF2283 domain-containing protein [Kibdelosporangium philippinense]MCE7003376.1 DUF2283 domain-containing protein [Kibdelosporangium philippinense]
MHVVGTLKITYDAEVDAAYIYLSPVDERHAVRASLRQPFVWSGPGSDMILDVEDGRKVHGIEILGASACLPEGLLELLRTPE